MMKQAWMLMVMATLAFAGWGTVQADDARREWSVSMSVEANGGDSKTTEKLQWGLSPLAYAGYHHQRRAFSN